MVLFLQYLGDSFAPENLNLASMYPLRGFIPGCRSKVDGGDIKRGFIPYNIILEETKAYELAISAWKPVHLGGAANVQYMVCGTLRTLSAYHYQDPRIQSFFKLDKICAASNVSLIDISDPHTQSNYRWDCPAMISIIQEMELTAPSGDLLKVGLHQGTRARRSFFELSYLIAFDLKKKKLSLPSETCKVLGKIQSSRCDNPIHQVLIISWSPKTPKTLIVEKVIRKTRSTFLVLF